MQSVGKVQGRVILVKPVASVSGITVSTELPYRTDTRRSTASGRSPLGVVSGRLDARASTTLRFGIETGVVMI